MPGQDKIKSAAHEAAGTAKAMAQDAVESARTEAEARAEAAKESVAKDVKSVASALRDASDEMRSGTPQERAVGQIAGALADVSDSIRDQDLGDMVNSVSSFARRNPVMFLSSAALIGFAAARFAKASDQEHAAGRPGSYSPPSSPAQSSYNPAPSSPAPGPGGTAPGTSAAPQQPGTPSPAINRGEV